MDGLKEFYFGLEDAYYGMLDSINETVPVYSIIDPIDKVIPSFALFIAAVLLILAGIAVTLSGGIPITPSDALTISVIDSKGNGVQGAGVTFTREGTQLGEVSTDAKGFARQGGIKKDDKIEVRVEKEAYLTASETVLIDELPKTKRVELQKESEAFVEKTIRLTDDLGQPVREAVTLEFRCSEPYAPSISSINLLPSDAGVGKVRVPSNCGRLTMSVKDNAKYKDITGIAVTREDEVVRLQEEEARTQNGTITVNVADSEGKQLENIQVNLYKYTELARDPHVGPIDSTFTAGGQGVFSRPAGEYVLKTYDTAGVYGEKASEKIRLPAEGKQQVAFTLQETVKGKIKVKVIDKSSKAGIQKAKVKLFYGTAQELSPQTTNKEGVAEFSISREVEYKATATADGYALGTLSGLKIDANAYKLELVKCTPSTCKNLRVKVVDQDNNPIQNATAALYDAQTNSVAPYDTRTTDINGIARFRSVSTGTYYAFAFKEGFEGRSDAAPFDSTQAEKTDTDLTVKMEIGEGSIAVKVRDAEGKPVPFAAISVFDARDNKLVKSDFTDSNGTKEFSLRADKKVYLVVNKSTEQRFALYTTVKKPLIVSTVQEFDVVLEKPILRNNIELKSIGLFQDGKQARTVKAGETYTAKFKLFVPEEKNYRSAGVHLRTGEDVIVEKDKLFIKEVNAPKASQSRVGRLEPEQSNLEEKDYDVTTSDAKWVNLDWVKPSAGVYEIEAEVSIRESAKIGDRLPLHYRAWGEKEEGGRDRFPIDDTVRKELYSNTKQELLQVETVTLCDEQFCFTATITDEKEGLVESVTETYNARVFNPYKLKFVITNNSDAKIHNNANLRVSNLDKTTKFFEYKLIDAETQETGGVLNSFEFPRLDVGNLGAKNSVRFETSFTPQKAGNGLVEIRLVSDQAIVYQKTLTILVSSPNEIEASISPETFLSGVENDVVVTVKDKATGLEIEGAVVRVKDKFGHVLDTDSTLADGTAKVTLPGQRPGEKLKVEIEKPNYNVRVIELEVSNKLLEIRPESIGVSLNTKSKLSSDEKFTVKNLTPYALTLKEVSLSGNFRNLVDSAKVRSWLDNSYKGMVVKEGETQELVLKTFLTEEAKALAERKSIEAELTVVTGNFGQEWVFKVPVRIAIGLGDEVDNPACLVVTKSEWVTSTTGPPKFTEVQIQNNCTVGGRPVDLQSLEAKVDWKGNQIGEYAIAFAEEKVALRSGYFRKLVGSMKAGQTISAILSFTPFGGVSGVANAEVTIQATNPLDAQDQVLANKIKTTINATNLDACVTYDKERLVVSQKETGTITITATEKCGEPVKFTLESQLRTNPKKDFTLEAGKSQAIEVFAEQSNAGQYPLFVTAKFGSDQKKQLTKNLRVVVNVPGCWQLSKYEFDVYDSPKSALDGFDTANFSNTCVEKPVAVKVKTKDFIKALKNGAVWGLATMGLTMLTNAADPNVDWKGSPEKPKAQQDARKQLDDLKKQKGEIESEIGKLEKQKAQEEKKTKPDDKALKSLQDQINTLKQQNENLSTKQSELQKQLAQTGQSSDSSDTTGKTESTYDEEVQKQIAQKSSSTQTPDADKPALEPADIFTGSDGKEYYRDEGRWRSVEDGSNANQEVSKGLEKFWQEVNTPATEPVETTLSYTQDGYRLISTKEGEAYWVDPSGNKVEDDATLRRLDSQAFQNQPPGNLVLATNIPTVQGLVTGITGYAPYGQGSSGGVDGRGVRTGIATQLGGGILGNVLGGGGGLVRGIFGTSPWAAGLLGFVAGTAISYLGQAEEANFTVLQKDAEVKQFSLVQGVPPNERADTEVELNVQGFGDAGAPTIPQPLVNKPELVSQGEETFRLTFTNKSKFITTEDKPKYKNLRAEGIRHKYKDKTYGKDDFFEEEGGIADTFFTSSVLDKKKTKLEEETPQPLEERFSLEFNSVPPQVETPQRPDLLLNCQAGEKVGRTGQDALPRVKLDWRWNAIEEQACNEDFKDADGKEKGIYCDATQFSISVLKKVNAVAEYVSQNGSSFSCPSPTEDKPATNIIGPKDIGVESVSVVKDGRKVEVIAKLTNTNPGQVTARARIKAVKIGATGEVQCPDGEQEVAVNAGSTKEARCTFPELAQGFYQAKVELTPSVSCENCADTAATNSLNRNFFAGSTGLQECAPFSTARLDKFLQASGINNDAMLKRVKFNALLMVDGYSADFQRDFDLALRQAFFNAPDSYKDQRTGLGVYFRDNRLFSFTSPDAVTQPDFVLSGPGTYSVVIDINYNDSSWQLFDGNGNPKARITVRLEKLRGAEPDSPFYYVPLNGLVGDGGRTGYGVNFSGDPVIIDNNPTPVRTVEMAGSTPIENGNLSVKRVKTFKALHIDNQGVVAKLSTAQGNPELFFQPSNATPVIMQIEKKSGSDAYAVYQVGVDGDAVDVGPTMAKWNGVGILCRAFNDEILAQQQNVPDTHMISASCSVARSGDRSLYTLEFCGEPKRFGTVSYETIFYTPQESDSSIKLSGAASDKARLIGIRTKADSIELNGNGITRRINSMQDIFDLVKEEFVCVSGTNINTEFFWNPKKIYSLINAKEEEAINACIASESSNVKVS